MSEVIATKRFNSGAVIFREGEIPDGMYIITAGKVEITKEKAGKKIFLASLGRDSVFGEMAMLDNMPRSATATAIVETTCYKVKSEDFEKKLDQMDSSLKGIFRVLVQTIRTMNERLAEKEDGEVEKK